MASGAVSRLDRYVESAEYVHTDPQTTYDSIYILRRSLQFFGSRNSTAGSHNFASPYKLCLVCEHQQQATVSLLVTVSAGDSL